jgi:hypothetical protein
MPGEPDRLDVAVELDKIGFGATVVTRLPHGFTRQRPVRGHRSPAKSVGVALRDGMACRWGLGTSIAGHHP